MKTKQYSVVSRTVIQNRTLQLCGFVRISNKNPMSETSTNYEENQLTL